MSYMKQVVAMLGLNWDDENDQSEEFRVYTADECARIASTFYISARSLHGIGSGYSFNEVSEIFFRLLTGQYKVVPMNWTPKDGDKYYLSDPTHIELYTVHSYHGHLQFCSRRYFNSGLAFRTKEEAIEASKKMLKALKGE